MLSAYEEERLKKIAENKRMLIALGIETEVQQMRFEIKAKSSPSAKKKAEPELLTDDQRAALSRAGQWLERFEVWLRGEVSQLNADIARRSAGRGKLVSGQGVHLKGHGVAFGGRAISIADDLVGLKEEAQNQFGVSRGNGADRGGWHLNHPIGKLLQFQRHLFSSVADVPGGAHRPPTRPTRRRRGSRMAPRWRW